MLSFSTVTPKGSPKKDFAPDLPDEEEAAVDGGRTKVHRSRLFSGHTNHGIPPPGPPPPHPSRPSPPPPPPHHPPPAPSPPPHPPSRPRPPPHPRPPVTPPPPPTPPPPTTRRRGGTSHPWRDCQQRSRLFSPGAFEKLEAAAIQGYSDHCSPPVTGQCCFLTRKKGARLQSSKPASESRDPQQNGKLTRRQTLGPQQPICPGQFPYLEPGPA